MRPGGSELGVRNQDDSRPSVGRLGLRIFRAVQPNVCLNSRNVCSMSTRLRNICHNRSTSSAPTSGSEQQPHRFGYRSPGR